MSNELNDFIEDRGLFCIRKYLTPKITDFMVAGSTKPSWDGSLIFREKPGKKEGCVEIPVQVKGTFDIEKFENNKASVSVVDLNNYKLNGILYFFVKMKIDEENNVIDDRVLYTILFHNDIDRILNALKKENQETVTLDFKEITSKIDLEHACEVFKQKKMMLNESSLLPSTVNIADISKITILNDTKYNAPVFGHNYFGQLESNGTKYFIDNLKVEEILLSKTNKVFVDDILYFDKVKLIQKEVETIIKLNESLHITIENSVNRLVLDFATNINSFRDALKFLCAALLKKSFKINAKQYSFENIDNDFFAYDNIASLLKTCEYLSLFLEKTNCKNKYLFNDFTSSQIEAIVNAFESKATEIKPYFIELKHNSIAFARGLINDTIEIYNILDKKFLDKFYFAIRDKNDVYTRTLPYSILEVEHLEKINFIDLKEYESHYNKYVELSESTAEDLNNFTLRMLLAYDKNKNRNLLNIALFNFKKLNEKFPDSPAYLVNLIQTMMRMKMSIKKYYEFIEKLTNDENQNYKFCGHVLFKNVYLASKIEIDDYMRKMPIYNLYEIIKEIEE